MPWLAQFPNGVVLLSFALWMLFSALWFLVLYPKARKSSRVSSSSHLNDYQRHDG